VSKRQSNNSCVHTLARFGGLQIGELHPLGITRSVASPRLPRLDRLLWSLGRLLYPANCCRPQPTPISGSDGIVADAVKFKYIPAPLTEAQLKEIFQVDAGALIWRQVRSLRRNAWPSTTPSANLFPCGGA
jgi:hypothetical protein